MKNRSFQIVEIIGVVSVVISLLIVAYEIRQTNKIAIVNAEIELRNNYSALNELMVTHSELAVMLIRNEEEGGKLSAAEHIRMRSFMFRHLNIWIASEIAYENGMLPEPSFQIVLNDVAFGLRNFPGLHPHFREILDNFGGWSETRVVKLIESELEQASLDAGRHD